MELFRTVLELLYFASAPVFTIIAAIGLWQLKITKDVARTNAKRNALAIAAQQCDHYHRHIIPLQETLDKAVDAKGITILKETEVTVSGKLVKVKFKKTDNFMDQVNNIGRELLVVLNAMEAFAVFFTTGTADERVAFSSVGNTFCASTYKLLPWIVVSVAQGYYRNLYELFQMWNSRIEAEKLMHDKKELEKKLNDLNNKFIDPIGTK
jgi:diadenosine tetraphosphate (Ap4A) HIT family hydrolase